MSAIQTENWSHCLKASTYHLCRFSFFRREIKREKVWENDLEKIRFWPACLYNRCGVWMWCSLSGISAQIYMSTYELDYTISLYFSSFLSSLFPYAAC